jgi:hypothetical protein
MGSRRPARIRRMTAAGMTCRPSRMPQRRAELRRLQTFRGQRRPIRIARLDPSPTKIVFMRSACYTDNRNIKNANPGGFDGHRYRQTWSSRCRPRSSRPSGTARWPTSVGVLLQQMRGKAVPQRVRRHALLTTPRNIQIRSAIFGQIRPNDLAVLAKPTCRGEPDPWRAD